jgi:hypothetical protein
MLAVALVAATPASAQTGSGDPVMPVAEMQPGMKCKGYSVIQGTGISEFDAEIMEIVGGGQDGGRVLVKVSGEAVDRTGVGSGFSGSPIYCTGADGRPKNAAAISETIGEYGGKVVLATPTESIVSNPPDAPGPRAPTATSSSVTKRFPNAKRLAAPLTIGGLDSRVFGFVKQIAARTGRTVLQAPPVPQRQAPPAPATNPFRPGSAVSVGLSSGAISIGAVGTVAYVDAEKVWSFGHPFDGVGPRALFLQDAYVAAVIANPNAGGEVGSTYKLAGAMSDLGSVGNDAFSAVVGRFGGPPPTIPVRVFTKDLDTGAQATVDVKVADETDLGNPTGASPLATVAPLAVTQAGTETMRSAPLRMAGQMCLQITLKERPKPIRICNRYVSDGTVPAPGGLGNLVALRAGNDVSEVMTLLDSYKPAGLHVTELAARIQVERGQRQAFMRKIRLPRRVRPGQTVPVKLDVQMIRGEKRTLSFRARIPRSLGRGDRTLTFRGAEADSADDDLFGALTITLGGDDEEEEDTTGPKDLKALVKEIKAIERYDGIRIGRSGLRFYKHPDLRLGGRVSTDVEVR